MLHSITSFNINKMAIQEYAFSKSTHPWKSFTLKPLPALKQLGTK